MVKLIIIDDEEETRSGLIETIEWEKLDVKIVGQAEDGSEGYELALVSHPDIVLIDVRMPGMDGIECAKAINRELPDCKIIFMSGYTDKEYLKAAIQLQAIDYIEKPIDNNEIYNVIKKTVLLCMSERVKKLREDEIKNKVEYSIKLMKQELAFELVHRNMDVNVLKSKYKEIDIPIDDNFLCILIDFNLHRIIGGENSLILSKNEVLKILGKECETIRQSCLYSILDSGLAIIHIYGKATENLSIIKDLLSNIQTSINKLYNCEGAVTIGAGKLVRGAENIYKSYQAARKAVYNRFTKGYNSIVFYEGDEYQQQIMDKELNNKLQWYINNVSIGNSVKLADEMINEIKKVQDVDVNSIKGALLSFLLKVSSLVKDLGLTMDESGRDQNLIWAEILNFYTLDEIKVFIIRKLEYINHQIEELKGKSKKIRVVIDFINKNYPEPISIAGIAEQINLSPNYLSLLFKKETGSTLNEYIEYVRIEKAKELLENEDMKLNEIAKRVGYNNPNYFTTVFRKATGMYPSEYRKKVL